MKLATLHYLCLPDLKIYLLISNETLKPRPSQMCSNGHMIPQQPPHGQILFSSNGGTGSIQVKLT